MLHHDSLTFGVSTLIRLPLLSLSRPPPHPPPGEALRFPRPHVALAICFVCRECRERRASNAMTQHIQHSACVGHHTQSVYMRFPTAHVGHPLLPTHMYTIILYVYIHAGARAFHHTLIHERAMHEYRFQKLSHSLPLHRTYMQVHMHPTHICTHLHTCVRMDTGYMYRDTHVRMGLSLETYVYRDI